jgi:hypothetical protein
MESFFPASSFDRREIFQGLIAPSTAAPAPSKLPHAPEHPNDFIGQERQILYDPIHILEEFVTFTSSQSHPSLSVQRLLIFSLTLS